MTDSIFWRKRLVERQLRADVDVGVIWKLKNGEVLKGVTFIVRLPKSERSMLIPTGIIFSCSEEVGGGSWGAVCWPSVSCSSHSGRNGS